MRSSKLLTVLGLLLLALSVAPAALAERATPTATAPLSTDPEACQVAPRSVESLRAILTTPPPASLSRVVDSRAVTIPLGQPADAATVAAVTQTAQESIACFNARDFLRLFALDTDHALRTAQASGFLSADALPFLTAPPSPLLEASRIKLLALSDVTLLPDGRVGAFGIQDDPSQPPAGPETDYIIFVHIGDRWLVDETVDTWLMPAGSPPGTPVADYWPPASRCGTERVVLDSSISRDRSAIDCKLTTGN